MPTQPRRWHWGSVAAIALLMLVEGCDFTKGGLPGSDGGDGGIWRVQPVRIRVYPSSRFTTVDHEPVLEARVEMLDAMGDPVKGVGRLRFELFAGGNPGQPQLTKRLYRWDITMLSLQQNRQYYDSITRTYLFSLQLHKPISADRNTTLQVTFTPPGGGRLEALVLFIAGERAATPVNSHAP